MTLAGKVALITGGAGGFGLAFAAALLREKTAAICLVDISKDGPLIASQLCREFQNGHVSYKYCDITDYDSFKDTFDFCKKKYGRIDIVCNNAGIVSHDNDLEKSVTALRLNMEAVYYGTKLGMDYMDKTDGGNGGVIVNVASMAAFLPVQHSMVYSGTKAGVVGLSRSAALEYDSNGVRVNSLCPSFTDTPILDSPNGPIRDSLLAASIPIMTVDIVAEAFMRLVTDASLNGATMRVTPQKGIDFYHFSRKDQKGFNLFARDQPASSKL